jgi:hypothetical protein
MRDILDKLDQLLTEANLGASEIPPNKMSAVINPATKKPFSRVELFYHKVKNSLPFTLKDGGEQVVINPKEAGKVAAWSLGAFLLSFSLLNVSGLVKSQIVLTASMSPTINPGDMVISTTPDKKAPQIGDVVLMKLPLVQNATTVYNMSRSTLAPVASQNYIDSASELGDGVQTVYTAASISVDTGLENAVEVYVGGIRQFTDYTVTAIAPVAATFTVAPADGSDVTILVRRGTWWVNPA